MNIKPVEPAVISFGPSKTITLKASDLKWSTADVPLGQAQVDYYRFSEHWDGTKVGWKIPPPVVKTSAEGKPRMWYSYADRRWYCQRYFVKGQGTTPRGAWDAMWQKIRSE